MPFVTSKRIKHLARYFGVAALACFASYQIGLFSHLFLLFLGPPFFLSAWLRMHGGAFVQWIPDSPFFNRFFLVLPLTLLYFGLAGFQLKNILNERGRLRLLSLILFLGFLLYLHYAAFQELSLYWEGSHRFKL